MDRVREHLTELLDVLRDGNGSRARALAEDLATDTTELEAKDYSFAVSLLLDSENGLIRFFRLTKGNKEFSEANQVLLQALSRFVFQTPAAVKPYAVDLKGFFDAPKESSRTKDASFSVLGPLLDPSYGIADPRKLEIGKIYELCVNHFGVLSLHKLTATVKGSTLRLLAQIGRYYPTYVERNQLCQPFLRAVLNTISSLFTSKTPDIPHVDGALKALDDLLFTSDPTVVKEFQKDIPRVFTDVVRCIEKVKDVTRFAIPISAMQIIVDHADVFQSHLHAEYPRVWAALRVATQHNNNDVQKVGYRAMDEFLKAVALYLTNADDTSPQAITKSKRCFTFLINQFAAILRDVNAIYKDRSLAVRGYGFFAAPCRQLADHDQLTYLVEELVKWAGLLFDKDDDGKEHYVHLPSFLEAYGFMIDALDDVSPELLHAIESLTTFLLSSFSTMNRNYRALCVRSFRSLLLRLYRKNAARVYWSRMAYRAIVVTCTQVLGQEDSPDLLAGGIGGLRVVFEDWMTFWNGLWLKKGYHKNLKAETEAPPIVKTDGMDLDENRGGMHEAVETKAEDAMDVDGSGDENEAEEFDRMVYDEIITAMMRLPRHLNLSLVDAESDTSSDQSKSTISEDKVITTSMTTNIGHLRAANVTDFTVLHSFVKFCQLFLPNVQTQLFHKWVFVAGDAWVTLSLRHPLVSAFYNLFGLVLELVGKLKWFKGVIGKERSGVCQGTDEDIRPEATELQRRTYHLFTSHLRHLLVIFPQFKDDLLASVLSVVLSAPVVLLNLDDCVSAVRTALRMGLSYPPMAQLAIESLERWARDCKQDVLKSVWKGVLPVVGEYLVGDSADGDEDTKPDGEKFGAIQVRKGQFRMRNLRRRRIQPTDEELNTQLKAIRLRILSLLGSIGGAYRYLLEGDHKEEQLLAWDPEIKVWFDIPFKETTCRVHLDDMLPRIVELAERSPDRKTKVAGGELLHALVLLMIGRSAKSLTNVGRTNDRESPFHRLYNRIFPALLRLAVDVDRVTRELYRPLVMQTIHWLTKNSKAENPETMAMLNACLDAVVTGKGSLREIGADGVAEFLKWSLKHSGTKDDGPINAKSLLKRINHMSLHSSSEKRLGASLVFNRIYRIVREEEPLVSQESFLITFHLLQSLRMAEADNPATGTQKEASAAVKHLVKIIKTRSDLFTKHDKKRKIPEGMQGDDLKAFVAWIFGECGRTERAYARCCIEVFMELCPNVQEPKEWIAGQPPGYVIRVFERGGLSVPRGESFESRRAGTWIHQLNAALDGYSFLVDAGLMDPVNIIQQRESKLMPALVYFVEMYGHAYFDDLDPATRFKVSTLRSYTVLRVLNFLESVLRKGGDRVANVLDTNGVMGPNFVKLLAKCVFKPVEVGFLTEDEEVKRQLPVVLETFLKILTRYITPNKRQLLCIALYDLYSAPDVRLEGKSLVDSAVILGLWQTTRGLGEVHRAGLLYEMMGDGADRFYDELYNTVKQTWSYDDPMVINVVGELLIICLSQSRTREKCLADLLGLGEGNALQNDAVVFYQRFSLFLNPLVMEQFDVFADGMRRYPERRIVEEILMSTLDHIAVQRITDRRLARDRVERILKNGEFFAKFADVNITAKNFERVVRIWKKVMQLDGKIVQSMRRTAAHTAFTETFLTLLGSDNFDVILETLDMLPIFLREPDLSSRVEAALSKIVANKFPLFPAELIEGTARWRSYCAAMKALLSAMEISDGIVLPRVLIPHICREKNHMFAPEFRHSIAVAARRLSPKEVSSLAEELFRHFLDMPLPVDLRCNIVSHMLVPVLGAAPVAKVAPVFAQEVTRIMTSITAPLTSGDGVIQQLEEVTMCYELMNICYARLPLQDIHKPGGRVFDAFANSQPGKELAKVLIKAANDSKAIVSPDYEVGLSFHQAALNLLVTILTATQADPEKLAKFSQAFVFAPPKKGARDPWLDIVNAKDDLRTLYSLNPDAADPFKRAPNAPAAELQSTRSDVDYLSSQYLAGSSLSQTFEQSLAATLANDLVDDGEISEKDVQHIQDNVVVVEEYRVFNHNPCMQALVGVIDKLTPPNPLIATQPMPQWMQELSKKMVDSESTLSLRLFIAGLIINRPKVFAPYASEWWVHIARLIEEHYVYAGEINILVQELCLVLIRWGNSEDEATSPKFVPENSYASKEVLRTLLSSLAISAGKAESMPHVNNNLRIIRAIVEMWAPLVVPPTRAICDYATMEGNSTERIKPLTGIFLLSIMVANGVQPYNAHGWGTDSVAVSPASFCESFAHLLSHAKKEVYAACAEALGRWIAFCESQKSDMMDNLLDNVAARLRTWNMVEGKPGEQDRLIMILNRISVGHPRIVADYATKLLFVLPRLHGTMKARCLEALASVPDTPNLFGHLRGHGMLEILQHRNDQTQTYMLVILLNMASSLNEEDIAHFLPTAMRIFPSHSSEKCRTAFYTMMMKLNSAHGRKVVSADLRRNLKLGVLQGLADSSDEIRDGVIKYLIREEDLSKKDIFTRTSTILGHFYDPEVEASFLGYSTNFLMEATKDSPGYHTKLFESGLPDAQFIDVSIDTSASLARAMVPLFASTQASGEQAVGLQTGFVRATQDMQWTPTQDVNVASARSLFSFSQSEISPSFGTGPTPMEVTTVGTGAPLSRPQRPNIPSLRRHDVRRNAAYFASQTERQRRAMARTQVLQKEARSRQVTLARKYRAGELPDIQIEHREIIDPMQTLAQLDAEIAKMLFGKLIGSVYLNVDEFADLEESEKANYKKDIEDQLQRILRTSTYFIPPVISAVLRCLYEIPKPNVDIAVLAHASEVSANSEVGIALLEKLIDSTRTAPLLRRRGTNRVNGPVAAVSTWIHLAGLYKLVAKQETYGSIYESHVSGLGIVKRAVAAESQGSYEHALNFYNDALAMEGALEDYEITICEQGQVECLARLGKWDDLMDIWMTDFGEDTSMMWESNRRDTLLSLFIRTFLRLRHGYKQGEMVVDWTEDEPNPLLSFVDDAMKDPTKRSYIESRYAKELAMLQVCRGNGSGATHYVQQAQQQLLVEFSTLHPLAQNARLRKLSNLQILHDISSFVQMAQNVRNSSETWKVVPLINRWRETYPSPSLDGVEVWDDLVTLRDILRENVASLVPQLSNLDLKDILEDGRRDDYITMAKVARKQRVPMVADNWLLKYPATTGFDSRLQYAIIKLTIEKMEQSSDAMAATMASSIISAVTYHAKKLAPLSATVRAKFLALEGRVYYKLADFLLLEPEDPSVVNELASNKYIRKAAVANNLPPPTDKASLMRFVLTRGLDCLRTACELDRREKLMTNLGAFCNLILSRAEERNFTELSFIDPQEIAAIMIRNVLNAMCEGYQPAIEFYPRLLELVETYKNAVDTFLAMSESIPSWTFLRWLPQMTALLDKDVGDVVYPSLLRVANDYPRALYYPLAISSEQYSFSSDPLCLNRRQNVQNLRDMLKSPLLETLTIELKRLTEPLHVLKDWVERVDDLLSRNASSQEIRTVFEEMAIYCIDHKNMGKIGREFSKRHGANIVKFCGKDGSKITSSKWKEMKLYYLKNVQGKEKMPAGVKPLKDYSPWLATFHNLDHEEPLEIPGQYGGSPGKPRPERHPMIARFDPNVLVMSSIRRPKRLIIYGTDEVAYKFLVKGGEDLRLDQRIQQLFSVMNDAMRNDPYCSRNQLKVRTYNVVPMSTSLGILEWVDNTIPFKAALESISGYTEAFNTAGASYQSFIDRYGRGSKNLEDLYGNVFMGASRQETIKTFKSLQIPQAFLRTWMYNLSASPEAFISIRETFAKSMATLSICSYILGIGDRHLDNHLLDVTTGEVIAIDFGHAFGSATETLSIPELMPFRLTKQVELVLEPLGVDVLMKYPMINTMRVMKAHKEVLLNTMNIFVKEPLMEWRKFALIQSLSKQASSTRSETPTASEGDTHESDTRRTSTAEVNPLTAPSWYPSQKLSIARRKLSMGNPAHITAQELEWGKGSKRWHSAMRAVVLGVPGENIRADAGMTCRDVQEQVECLIDLATDGSVLGKTWRGWAPFV
ncbi:hypothetical protein HDU85_005175 [Gaertneriomyces sp. JEL0708]|nr:hypothetical protein HDU85_005175 [Gaertneriomyces sp. JEL0708]